MSFTNPRVQRLRRLLGRRSSRSEEGALVIEGPVMVAEAIAAGWAVEAQFTAPGVEPVTTGAATPVARLAPGVAERVSDLESPTGLFAVVARPSRDAAATLAAASFVVVADRIAEPGNLGTIIRSAEAAGADAVVVTPGTVDETNPKVVRASAGALFHVPVVPAGLADVAAAGLRVIATSSHRGVAHTAFDWSGRVAVVAGNEAAGVDPAEPAITDWVRIEHHGRAESLNVAMATTVLCFEVARDRPD
ncbi:TrmH family RNA methyltransferase [Desertimonas flava]|uniref:TrmH family RNA methyltransferase n=1 Tax=Desertimonas flava TaxID=2064846 RepID=UPI003B8317ED